MSDTMTLVPARARGWRAGFANVWNKEHGIWWRTRRWAIHLVLWIAVINGFLVLVGFDGGGTRDIRSPGNLREIIEVFFRAGGMFATIGIITALQSVIVAEKQLGTAAWLLTKPVSRAAVVLAKLAAGAYVVLFLMVFVPAALFQVHVRLVWGSFIGPGFFAGLGLLVLSHLFYVAFTVMLGTLFTRRGPVSGVAFGFLFAGLVLPNFLPMAVMQWTPWTLHNLAAQAAIGEKLPSFAWSPIAVTVLLIVVAVAVALERFRREEF